MGAGHMITVTVIYIMLMSLALALQIHSGPTSGACSTTDVCRSHFTTSHNRSALHLTYHPMVWLPVVPVVPVF